MARERNLSKRDDVGNAPSGSVAGREASYLRSWSFSSLAWAVSRDPRPPSPVAPTLERSAVSLTSCSVGSAWSGSLKTIERSSARELKEPKSFPERNEREGMACGVGRKRDGRGRVGESAG